jgi:transcriptional regulator with XRE-family HTH domain
MHLNQWRVANDLTMAQAAERLGISQPSISRIESGAHLPGRVTIAKLVKYSDGAISGADLYAEWSRLQSLGNDAPAGAMRTAAEHFRDFARRFSIATRAHENARHTSMSQDRAELAFSMMQALEAEFERCFQLRAEPDWKAVERAAMGEGGQ